MQKQFLTAVRKNFVHIFARKNTVDRDYRTFARKGIKAHFGYRTAVARKMQRSVNMSACVGAHTNGRKIVIIAVFNTFYSVYLGLRVALVDLACENIP